MIDMAKAIVPKIIFPKCIRNTNALNCIISVSFGPPDYVRKMEKKSMNEIGSND